MERKKIKKVNFFFSFLWSDENKKEKDMKENQVENVGNKLEKFSSHFL